MATIKIDEHGVATVTMSNGGAFPVPPFVAITIGAGAYPELITLAGGGEWWITDYRCELIDDLAGDHLADGEKFTSCDGATWTRYGDELLVVTPGQRVDMVAALVAAAP
jgi:hypothetical protein